MKVKKILECICVNCGKLKADIVSCVSFFPARFAPPLSQFSGGSLQIPWRTPNPRRCVRPRQRGVLPPTARSLARFRSLDRRDVTTLCALGTVGPPVAGEMGGRARSAKKILKKTMTLSSSSWMEIAGLFGAVKQLLGHVFSTHLVRIVVRPSVACFDVCYCLSEKDVSSICLLTFSSTCLDFEYVIPSSFSTGPPSPTSPSRRKFVYIVILRVGWLRFGAIAKERRFARQTI